MLYCPTCQSSVLAPQIELDYELFAHNCSSDGVRSASLADAVGDDKILQIIETYPEDNRVSSNKRVLSEQIDAILDQLIVAKSIQDDTWYQELLEQLKLLRSMDNINRH